MLPTKIKKNVYFVTHGEEKNHYELPNFISRKIWLVNWNLCLDNFVSIISYCKRSSMNKIVYEVAFLQIEIWGNSQSISW